MTGARAGGGAARGSTLEAGAVCPLARGCRRWRVHHVGWCGGGVGGQPSPTLGFARAGTPTAAQRGRRSLGGTHRVDARRGRGLLAGLVTAVAVERDRDRERAERQGVSALVTKDASVDEASAWPDGNRQAWAPRSLGRPRRLVAYGPDLGAARYPRRHPGHRLDRQARKPGLRAVVPTGAVMTGGIVAVGGGRNEGGSGRIVHVCRGRQRRRQRDEEWEPPDTRRGGRTG